MNSSRPCPAATATRCSTSSCPNSTPGPRDLLVEVRAISVNPVDDQGAAARPACRGSVQGTRLGRCRRGPRGGQRSQPAPPGDKVRYAGDLTRPGSNAELQLVDERIVGAMPQSLDFAHAAALPLTTITAWELLFHRLQWPRAAPARARPC